MKRLCFLLLIILSLSGKLWAQDLTFSQFYEKPLLRNPALAGVFDGDIRMIGIHRNQWGSITVPFQTSAASIEYKFPIGRWDDWITAGLQMTQDAAGDIKLKRTQFFPVINFHKSLSSDVDRYISGAFMFGPVNSQFDPTKVQLGDQFINGAFNPNNPTQQVFNRTGFTYWDLSTGLTFSNGFGDYGKYYFGIAGFHLLKPKVSFYADNGDSSRLPRKLVLNAGLSSPTSDNNSIVMFADYFKQGGNEQFLGGVLYGTELSRNYDDGLATTLYFGGFYRWNDAFIPVVKMDIKRFNIGISYDVNISRLKTASQWRGGLELTMSYIAKLRNRSYEGSRVVCPRF